MILPIGDEQYHQVNCIQHYCRCYYRGTGTTAQVKAQVTLKEQIKVMVQLQGGI